MAGSNIWPGDAFSDFRDAKSSASRFSRVKVPKRHGLSTANENPRVKFLANR